MERTQISLNPAERSLLDAEMARTGRSMSALVRDAVHATYGGGHRDVDDDLAVLSAVSGAWTGRSTDGADWVDSLRSGSRLSER
ncbi:ribbon-helix-helix protein, CopG family [uncultured Amnibacterium sp.]|uniref:ribbon-helix-helix protein, CopG family n=1 Tax=uncultured Amnibacterium sp. TaxID=1631851 RepID=UPI0035CB8224